MGKFEILGGAERRRRWSVEQKLAIVAEAEESGAVSKVARRHDLHPNQVFGWRLKVRRGELAPAGFVPVVLDDTPAASAEPPGHFEVQLGNGRVARFSETVAPERLLGLVRVLERT